MTLTKLTLDLSHVSALDPEPNDVGGLTAPLLQGIFDQAGNEIKAYINNTITTEQDAENVSLQEQISGNDTTQTNALNAHKSSDDHDNLYYTKTELAPYLSGGDTLILYDVYTIINPDLGNGTFSYLDKNGATQIGTITVEGYQVFALQNGTYQLNNNMIEATIDDTLQRSVASGGLQEIDITHVALTVPIASGEVTIKYYQRVGVTGTGLIVVSPAQPPSGFVWFKVV